VEQDHFKHLDENVTYLDAGRLVKVDDLLDYLDDKRHNRRLQDGQPEQAHAGDETAHAWCRATVEMSAPDKTL